MSVGLLLALAGTGMPMAPAQAAASDAISGTVTGADGSPLSTVEVTAYSWLVDEDDWEWSATVETDGSGTYGFAGLEPGTYRVGFEDLSGDHQREYYDDVSSLYDADTLTVTGTTGLTGVDARLAPAGHVTGTVTGPDGPAVGVEVAAYQWVAGYGGWWDQVAWATTDDTGAYDLGGLTTGSYRVGFSDWNGAYVAEYWDDVETLDAATTVPVATGATVSGIDAVLAPAGHVTGTVTGADGSPVVDGLVSAYQWDAESEYWAWAFYAQTDATGAYDVGGLPTGTYRIGFWDYTGRHLEEYWDDAATVESATDVPVTQGATVTGRDARLRLGGSITGVVTGPTSVADVWVTAWEKVGGSWEYASSNYVDDGGRYELRGLRSGTYRISFEDDRGALRTEYWDDAATISAANDVVVVEGAVSSGKNAALTSATTQAYQNLSAPTIAGTPQVGQTLVASPGTWTPAGASYGYEWLVDGVPAGSGATLPLTEAHLGKRISVRVTAYGPDRVAGSVTSTATAPVTAQPTVQPAPPAPPTLANTAAPRIKGKARVGRTLRVTTGTWSPSSGVRFSYQWLANGKRIKKATRAKLKVTKALKGKKVRVKVTARLAGAPSVTVRTKPTAKIKA